jgi:hypothetical protein
LHFAFCTLHYLSPPLPKESRPKSARSDGILRVVLWTSLYAVPACVALLPILDPDIWWHLRCGQWVFAHKAVPVADPFSQFGLESGKPWYAYSWLFEVLSFAAWSLGGPRGIFVGRAMLALLIVAALHRLVARRVGHFLTAAALLGLAVLGLLPLITDRPWLFTILFSALILDVVLDLREGRPAKRVWLLPLLFVVWANLHIQFVYGLLLLGLACAAPLMDRLRRRDQDLIGAAKAGTAAWWRLVGATGLCAAATLATPYHVHLYGVVVEYATHRVPAATVAEFQSLEFRNFWDWCVLALGALAAFALGRRARLSSFEVLLLAAAAVFAFKGRRDVWFLVLAALAVIPSPRGKEGRGEFLPTGRQTAAVAVLVLLVLAGYWHYAQAGPEFQNTLEKQYPVRAVEFVRCAGCPGPLYNSFDWGGYLIWALPELPVAMDGRTNLHTDARIARHLDTWLGRPGWDSDPELAAAGVIIAEKRVPLTSLLRHDERFRHVHEDDVAVVFVRR